jgi:hypothetical protein
MRTCDLLVAAFAVPVAACGITDAERHGTLRTRAAFDLKCNADALKITDLTNNGDMGRVTSAGVDGCGQRVTYIFDGKRGVWLMNAVNGQPATDTNNAVGNDHAQKEANQ